MTKVPLSDAQRQRLLHAIRDAIVAASGGAPGDPNLLRWGGIGTIDQHLDDLVGVAERVPRGHGQVYLAEILENVCSSCRQQQLTGYCPLRHIDACALYRCAVPIVDAIIHCLEADGAYHPCMPA